MSTSSSNKLISSSPMQSGTGLNTSGLVGSVDSPDDYNNKHFDSNLGKSLFKKKLLLNS